ncbi:MAG: NUDIX hydrolase [Pirellulales bacterium]|nr:NUDIX hydrolase [Pirellulales bacterium]
MEDDRPLLHTPRFDVVERTYRAPDGSTHFRAYVQHPGAVAILPLFDDGKICLIRNFRPAVGHELFELPAGTREPGEAPLATATRELEEETGYAAVRIERLCEFWMSPGILNERMHVFVARGLQRGKASLDKGEIVAPHIVSHDEAMAMVADGRIQDAKSVAALLYFEQFAAR